MTESSAGDAGEKVVGVIGLGAMGGGMARALHDRGFSVVGFDLDGARLAEAAGAGVLPAADVADLCRRADIALVSVAGQSHLLAVAAAIASAGRSGLLVVDASTVDPKTSAEARARLEAASCRLLCAAASGSSEFARAGRLSLFCSGSDADYRDAGPVLDGIAGSHSLVGEGEVARTAKLIVNLVLIGTLELAAEALALAEAGGLSRADAMDLLGASVVDSPFLRYKRGALVDADYEPTAALSLARKDLGLIAAAAAEADLDLPVCNAVDSVYEIAERLGLGDRDFAAVAEAIGR